MREYTMQLSDGSKQTLQAKNDDSALAKANKTATKKNLYLDVLYDTNDISIEDGATIVWQI